MFEAAENPQADEAPPGIPLQCKVRIAQPSDERGLQELVDSLQDALTLPASLNISLIGLSSHILPQFIHILGGTLIPTAISITTTSPDDAAAILTLLASDDDDDLVDTLDLCFFLLIHSGSDVKDMLPTEF